MADQDQSTSQKQIAIQKIYVKDFSFESPHTPAVFSRTDWSPKTNLNLRSRHTTGSNILFPYARESVANIVSKGGFPEFLLQPINFDALYAQGMAQARAKSQEQPAAAGSNGGGNGGST